MAVGIGPEARANQPIQQTSSIQPIERLTDKVTYFTGVVHTCNDNTPVKELSESARSKKINELMEEHRQLHAACPSLSYEIDPKPIEVIEYTGEF